MPLEIDVDGRGGAAVSSVTGSDLYPTGIAWLGDIPEHWDVRRLKYIVDFCGGGTPSKSDEAFWGGDIPWVSPKDMKTDLIHNTEDHITEAAVRASATRMVPAGAVLLVVRSGILRHSIPVAIAGRPLALNQDMKALIPKGDCEPRYLKYTIQGRQHALRLAWTKTGATVQSIEHELLANTLFPVPPLAEQRAIADFLDEKTAAIDALIAKKERLIALFAERRLSLITQAVTGGIGIEIKAAEPQRRYLDSIPPHWQIVRLKYLAREPLMYGANESAELTDPDLPRYIRITDLNPDGTLRDETFRSLPEESARPYLLAEGDILLARSGATVGKAVRYRREWGRACFAGYLIRFRADTRKIRPEFVEYYTQSLPYLREVQLSMVQATIPNVSAERYGAFFIPVPPLEEQGAIVSFLDKASQRLANATTAVRRQIEKLREYRQTLISAAVTGQIGIRREIEVPA